jgi:hypothetical protein
MSDLNLPEVLGFNQVTNMSKPEIREFITKIEDLCRDGEQVEMPITHRFSYGVYAREMQVPKGMLIVGKIHKRQNLNILSAGEASVLSIDGIIRVKAPYTFVAGEGVKRVIYTHEDTVWTTIHGTHETDIEKIEEEFIAKSYEELPPVIMAELIDVKEDTCLGSQSES